MFLHFVQSFSFPYNSSGVLRTWVGMSEITTEITTSREAQRSLRTQAYFTLNTAIEYRYGAGQKPGNTWLPGTFQLQTTPELYHEALTNG